MIMAAAFALAALAGCQRHEADSDTTGTAAMDISLPAGSRIVSVHYSITGNNIPEIAASIDISGAGATTSFQVTGIPAGAGYAVRLDAESTDHATTCTGRASFDIAAGATTRVTVLLQCTGANTGTVVVNGVWCPVVSAYAISPLTIAVGGTIHVAAQAHDIDPADDATPTFAWSATAGSFASASSADTTYTCATAGTQTVTLKVSATSPTVDVAACSSTSSTTVTCVPLSCGNGTLDAGEQCDPPNGTTCDSNCLQIPVCGNHVVEAPPGPYTPEQCDPPNGTTCDDHCQNIPVVCGNGIVQPGEECDPPNGTTCDATCHLIQGPRCGDGVVNGTEQCEPPNTPATNFTAACDANCLFSGVSLCSACEATKCDALFGAPHAWGCSDLTGAAKTNCEALLDCIRTSHCAAATHDAQACYCGTASDIACLTGGANGSCKAKYETAAGTTDPGVIAGLFTDPASPVGRADNEITCDADTTAPVCTAVCPL
jgi:hypothetical protein